MLQHTEEQLTAIRRFTTFKTLKLPSQLVVIYCIVATTFLPVTSALHTGSIEALNMHRGIGPALRIKEAKLKQWSTPDSAPATVSAYANLQARARAIPCRRFRGRGASGSEL